MDLHQYDIAHYLGHKALDHLQKAYEIYSAPISIVLAKNKVNILSVDFKENHDIASEMSRKKVTDINIDDIDPINAFHFANQLNLIKIKEVEHCIDTSIYFQSMMEAVINDVFYSNDWNRFFKNTPIRPKEKESFYDKWDNLLKSNYANEDELRFFASYKNNIYDKIRIPSVHAKNRNGLTNIEVHNFSFVHENIKNGWFTFVFLLNKTKGFSLNYEENWKMMSESHNIPAVINKKNYPDYSSLIEALYKKHTDHFNDQIK